jgi:hypothetical protein
MSAATFSCSLVFLAKTDPLFNRNTPSVEAQQNFYRIQTELLFALNTSSVSLEGLLRCKAHQSLLNFHKPALDKNILLLNESIPNANAVVSQISQQTTPLAKHYTKNHPSSEPERNFSQTNCCCG